MQGNLALVFPKSLTGSVLANTTLLKFNRDRFLIVF